MLPRIRYKVIACSVFRPEYNYIRNLLPSSIELDITWLELGLHREPQRLNGLIRDEIAVVDSSCETFDAILLMYGLCSRSTVGLTSNRHRLVMARAHDCITLFLGSKDRYRNEFDQAPGTYWFTRGYIDGIKHTGYSETYEGIYSEYEDNYEAYVEQFGDHELARHVIENQEQAWIANYSRGALVESGLTDDEHLREKARSYCHQRGWEFVRVSGNHELIRDLLAGKWDKERFVIVNPGETFDIGAPDEILTVARLSEPLPVSDGKLHVAYRFNGIYEPCELEEIERLDDSADIVIGIDAGGTCTDAVVVSLQEKRILASAKSVTTHDDLSIGIDRTLRMLPDDLIAKAERLAISTTLATNAIVEGKGSRTGLILIGYPPATATLVHIGAGDRKMTIGGSHDIDGNERYPLDEQALISAIEILISDGIESIAITSLMGTRNPAHEKRAYYVIRSQWNIPVVTGHLVSNDLDAVKRAHTTLLNARLTPVIGHLIDSVTATTESLGLPGDIRFVTTDSTLMNAQEARKQPVRMILSGPAASVMGARFLTGIDSAVVVDIGGTTTDISILEHGTLRRSKNSATIGGYRTSIRAAEMRTMGLGGDSWIKFANGAFMVGPRRVMPISQLTTVVPEVQNCLIELVEKTSENHGLVQPGTFYLYVKKPAATSFFTESERSALNIISEGPISEINLAERLGALHPSLIGLGRLEDLGIILRSGLTPTDLVVLDTPNERRNTNTQAASLLLGMYAECAGLSREECIDSIWRIVHKTVASGVITEAVGYENRELHFPGCHFCDQAFEKHTAIEVIYRLKWPLVAIGAPAKRMLQGMEQYLIAKKIHPVHREVANAVGAAACSGGTHIDMQIIQSDSGRFLLFAPDGRHTCTTRDEAKKRAELICRELAQSYAAEMGYERFTLEVKITDRSALTGFGSPLYIDTAVTAHLRY